MRIGVHFNFQNYADWERFEARRPSSPVVSDQQRYAEDLHLGSLVEPLGFDPTGRSTTTFRRTS
jgi:hypothetical protein